MLTSRPPRRNWYRVLLCCALTGACLPAATASAIGPYVRIEQDWALEMATVDPNFPSPQISIMMEPFPNCSQGGVLLLNYSDTPSFAAGGYQLQLWDGTTCTATLAKDTGMLLKTNEKITFTTFMELSNGNLNFGISKANFPTWNTLPGKGYSISMPYTGVSTFTGNYDTADTVDGSGVLVGSTADVKVLKINSVRKYDTAGKSDNEPSTQVFP